MSQPKFKVGDTFLEENGVINEIIFVAPTITNDGHWSYFVKVTCHDIPDWLKYDYTYENFFVKYCEKIIVEKEWEKLNREVIEKLKKMSKEELNLVFSELIVELNDNFDRQILEGFKL